MDKFDDALTSIERNQDVNELYFEKAYCEYRLNKVESAYATLNECKQMGLKEKELMAQVVNIHQCFNSFSPIQLNYDMLSH